MAFIFIVSLAAVEFKLLESSQPSQLNAQSKELLPHKSQKFGALLTYNAKTASFEYNSGYTGAVNPDSELDSVGTARVNASFSTDGSKGVSVTDPANKN